VYRYLGKIAHLPTDASPPLGTREWDMTAVIARDSVDAGGVLLAQGTMNGGIAVYVAGNRLVVAYNGHGKISRIQSQELVPVGSTVLHVRLRRRPPGGEVALKIGDGPIEVTAVPSLPRMRSSIGMDIGLDRGSPVVAEYVAPGEFSGWLESLTVELVPMGVEAAIEDAAHRFLHEMSRQ
jgi:arylsulfatase